jgi:mannose-6-phosphate isomerase-like protein (cupin superfamily)
VDDIGTPSGGTPDASTPHPYHLPSGEGEARWWLGALATIKASSADTDGRYALVELLEPEGADGPLHVHHHEDEGFWILEGSFTFLIGDRTHRAGPGSFLFGPRGVPHSYRVDRGPGRLLFVLSPAGFEDFIRETSEPAPSRALPPDAAALPDEAAMAALAVTAQRFGAEILGDADYGE